MAVSDWPRSDEGRRLRRQSRRRRGRFPRCRGGRSVSHRQAIRTSRAPRTFRRSEESLPRRRRPIRPWTAPHTARRWLFEREGTSVHQPGRLRAVTDRAPIADGPNVFRTAAPDAVGIVQRAAVLLGPARCAAPEENAPLPPRPRLRLRPQPTMRESPAGTRRPLRTTSTESRRAVPRRPPRATRSSPSSRTDSSSLRRSRPDRPRSGPPRLDPSSH